MEDEIFDLKKFIDVMDKLRAFFKEHKDRRGRLCIDGAGDLPSVIVPMKPEMEEIDVFELVHDVCGLIGETCDFILGATLTFEHGNGADAA